MGFESSNYPKHEFNAQGIKYSIDEFQWELLDLSNFPNNEEMYRFFNSSSHLITQQALLELPNQDLENIKAAESIDLNQPHADKSITQKMLPQPATEKSLLNDSRYFVSQYDNRIFILAGCISRTDHFQVFNPKHMYFFNEQNRTFLKIKDFNNYIQHSFSMPLIFMLFGSGRALIYDFNKSVAYLSTPHTLIQLSIIDSHQFRSITQENTHNIRECVVGESLYIIFWDDDKQLQLYNIAIDETQKTMQLRLLSETPYTYTSLSSWKVTTLGNNCIAMLFSGVLPKTPSTLSFDMLTYNTHDLKWRSSSIGKSIQLKLPENMNVSNLQLKYNPPNCVIVIQSLSSGSNFVPILLSIRFPIERTVSNQVCEQCLVRIDNLETYEFSNKKLPFISNGMMYSLAQSIRFPFHAIKMLVECALTLSATHIAISLQQQLHNKDYLMLKFAGSSLTRQQYLSIISHSLKDDHTVQKISNKLKLGAFRLCKTLLFTSYEPQTHILNVFMFSANGMIISNFSELYSYLSYEQNLQTSRISTIEGFQHKYQILNYLKLFVNNPEQLIKTNSDISSTGNTKYNIYLYETNQVINSQKQYCPQLISGIKDSDIILARNMTEVNFLDDLGFGLSSSMDISLAEFLQECFLTHKQSDKMAVVYPQTNLLTIQVANKQIHYSTSSNPTNIFNNHYESQLRNLVAVGKLSVLRESCRLSISAQIVIEIFICETVTQLQGNKVMENQQSVVPGLKGILMYYQNNFIDRFEVAVGDLLKLKFYKKKYRGSFNLWQYSGIVNVKSGLEVSLSGDSFKKNQAYYQLIRFIRQEVLQKDHQPMRVLLAQGDRRQAEGIRHLTRQQHLRGQSNLTYQNKSQGSITKQRDSTTILRSNDARQKHQSEDSQQFLAPQGRKQVKND